MLRYATLCDTISYHTILCHTKPYYAMICSCCSCLFVRNSTRLVLVLRRQLPRDVLWGSNCARTEIYLHPRPKAYILALMCARVRVLCVFILFI